MDEKKDEDNLEENSQEIKKSLHSDTTENSKTENENPKSDEFSGENEIKIETEEKLDKDDFEKQQLSHEVENLKEQLNQAKEANLRQFAELENFKKRMMQEQKGLVEYANEKLLLDILDLLDNFDRAIDSCVQSKNFDALYEGIIMTKNEFLSKLKNKYHLEAFAQHGEIFDPHIHEAIAVSNDEEEKEEPTLAEIYQKGYKWKDKTLRLAKVKIKTKKD